MSGVFQLLENEFAIHVAAGEVVFENLDTVRHIASYVARKRRIARLGLAAARLRLASPG